MNLLHQTILITLDIYRKIDRDLLIKLTVSHGFDHDEIVEAIDLLIKRRQVKAVDSSLEYVEEAPEEIPQNYLDAADNFRKSRESQGFGPVVQWMVGAWHKIWGAVILLIATTFLTIGLCAAEWRLVEATAYCPNCKICDTTWITANGTDCRERVYGIAASNDIPLGSTIIIPRGYGYMDVRFSDRQFVCDDRGGALNADRDNGSPTRIDLRYRTHASAVQFGRKLMYVLLNKVK